MSNDFKKLKGTINRVVGEATGDRGHEAKGTVEEATGREPEDESEIAEAQRAVKESHHDYGERMPSDDERVPPQEVPHEER